MEIWWAEHQWPLASDWSGIWMDLLWPTLLSIASYSTYTDAVDNTISQNLLAEPRRMFQLLNAVRAEWKTTANILSVWLLKLCLSGGLQTSSDSAPKSCWTRPKLKIYKPHRCPLVVVPLCFITAEQHPVESLIYLITAIAIGQL